MEEVDEYQYLGRLLTPENEMRAEVDRKITTGLQIFGQYSNFLKDSKIPICLNRKIMDIVILPVLTDGAETCTVIIHLEIL